MSIYKKIRLASEVDSESILEIYAPFVRDTVISFEYEVPNLDDIRKRITDTQTKYPWLVCEIENKIIGYAYASSHRKRSAYDWSVDFSIYVNPVYHRKKIATALYYCLAELLKLQGYYNGYAGIALPNAKSEGFHESFGFKPIGIYENVGYKFNNWHSVKWFSLKLAEHPKLPLKPKTINQIRNTSDFNRILKEAEGFISNEFEIDNE